MEGIMSSWDEVLAEFKADEAPESIVPLIEDERLRNAVVAWKSVTVQRTGKDNCEIQGDVARWNWLWTQVQYDQETFGTVAGLKPQDVKPVMTRLMGLRMIYPDGSINNFAKQFLQAIIMQRLQGKKAPGRPKKPAGS
jgi:hypothetical protein